MEFKDRLKLARKRAKMNQTELGKAVGLDQTSISDLERGKSLSTSAVAELAYALGVSARWLATGEGEMDEAKVSTIRQVDANVEPAPKMSGTVPLISWVQAGSWTDVGNVAIDLSEAEYYPAPPGCGPNGFALRVRGESMIEEYKPGAIIYVDPDAEARSGDDVVVQCEQHGGAEATFKRLIIEPGETKLLKALNSAWREQYMELTPDCRIIGVVVAQLMIKSR